MSEEKHIRSFDEQLERLKQYCAYRERSVNETRQKAMSLGLSETQIEQALETLEAVGFLDEERFAFSYTRGHIIHNKWGKIKVRMGLRAAGVRSEHIEHALATSIEEEEYLEILNKVLESKRSKDRNQLIKFALQRGFEYELIVEQLKR